MTAVSELLEQRVAVVTGGARGLGAAISSCLAASGARGAVLDLGAAHDGLPPPGWITIEADVRRPDSLERAFAEVTGQFGSIDIAVANAGIVPPWSSTESISLATWEEVFAVNARGVMLTIRSAVQAMRRGGGSVVAVSSLNGWQGDPKLATYVASKHAVVGLVRAVALDVGPRNIRVNAVGPGPVATAALLERMKAREQEGGPCVARALEQAAANTALGRLVTEQEVASAVLFLSSELASGITGQLIAIDAGVP
jgi:NAD(P)-dependent dehydrogenase (short-subunit alcohol dehydrogenase family)